MRISVVILLAAISIVNASPFHIYKRAVPLVPCTPPSDIVLTGTIDPDPAPGGTAKAKLSFTTAADVPKLLLTTTVSDGDAKTAKVTTADLCAGGLKCPVPKGQAIDVTSSTEIPADIKTPFTIEYNFNDGAKVVSCGVGKVAGGAPGAAPPPDGAPKDGAPKDGAPKDGAPKDGAPKDGAPKDAPPDGGPPKGGDAPPDGGPPKGGDAPPDGGPPKGGDAPPDGGPPKGGDAPPDGGPPDPPKEP